MCTTDVDDDADESDCRTELAMECGKQRLDTYFSRSVEEQEESEVVLPEERSWNEVGLAILQLTKWINRLRANKLFKIRGEHLSQGPKMAP